ncbi:hypothetical protein BU16DRAFT_375334 [Lophium mytilinum]|uniref:Magnesium transporter n=1 Tax=Lophium mytilinum TaxID=390894 RepID=A0A6A6QX07_9PEZI|nr:hypothetical protein BU16DRAFT_375334 [Lophium mytilinum]
MTLISTSLNGLGLVLLTHAVYSAHEHSLLPTTAALPLDITIELLAAVLLLCIGIVLASPDLKPIKWSVWGGKLSREEHKAAEKAGDVTERDPYEQLDVRRGFLDIRSKRQDFADWVREGATK